MTGFSGYVDAAPGPPDLNSMDWATLRPHRAWNGLDYATIGAGVAILLGFVGSFIPSYADRLSLLMPAGLFVVSMVGFYVRATEDIDGP